MWSSLVNSGPTLVTGHYSIGRPKRQEFSSIDTDFGELIYVEIFRTLVSSAYPMFPPANAG